MGKLRKACANCIKYKLACEAKRPCSRCVLHQCDCIDVERKPRAARKPKRPRISLETPFAPACIDPSTLPGGVKATLSPTLGSSNSPPTTFIPELVLNDNEPQFAANNMPEQSPFLQQADASLMPFSSYMFGNSPSLLSSVLTIDQTIPPAQVFSTDKEDSQIRNYFTIGIDDLPKKSVGASAGDATFASPFVSALPLSSSQLISMPVHTPHVMNPTSKLVLPSPQPLVVAEKAGCTILDCNSEFANFLGYESAVDFTNNVTKLEDVIVADMGGFGKKSLDVFLNTKVQHFERMGALRGRDGMDRTVTFHVDVMEKLIMFTVKEVYDMRPIQNMQNIQNSFFARWPVKQEFPCERPNCQCKFYGLSCHQPQQITPQQQMQLHQGLLHTLNL